MGKEGGKGLDGVGIEMYGVYVEGVALGIGVESVMMALLDLLGSGGAHSLLGGGFQFVVT